MITKIDDNEITSMEDLTNVKKKYSAGDTSTFTIYREGASTTVEVTWSAVPQEEQSNVTQDQTQNDQYNQYGGGYYNPYDMFEYFFGNRYN